MGIVESCSQRDPRQKTDMKSLGKDFITASETQDTSELKEVTKYANTSKKFMKDYSYLFQESIIAEPGEIQYFKSRFEVENYYKTRSLKIRIIIAKMAQYLGESKMEMIEQIKGFYDYATIRRFLEMHEYNTQATLEAIYLDSIYKNEKLLKLTKQNTSKILATKRFFFCGLTINRLVCLGIRPNFEKFEPIDVEQFEDFLLHLFETVLFKLFTDKKKKKIRNRVVFLLDFDNLKPNSGIIQKILEFNKTHYPGCIDRVMIVKLNLGLVDEQFVDLMKKNTEFFLVFDDKFKENILKYIRPDAFIVPYGGTKQYSSQYNLAEKDFNFDFDECLR